MRIATAVLLAATVVATAAGAQERERTCERWVPCEPTDLEEPARVFEDGCLLEDLDYMRAPLFRVVSARPLRLRRALPAVEPSRYSRRAPRRVPAGTLVLGSRAVRGWRCVYVAHPDGLYAGFAPVASLERVDDPPAPRDAACLVGDWFEGRVLPRPGSHPDHVRVSIEPNGSLRLIGEAFWGGTRDHPDLHTAFYDGQIEWRAGRAAGTAGCSIELVARGPFLMIADDDTCGEPNARFVGIYVRATSPIEFHAARAPAR